MAGHQVAGIQLAHADSWAGSGSKLLLPREAREARERELLAELAAEVRTTLVHEIGHYLGLEEGDLEARGLE